MPQAPRRSKRAAIAAALLAAFVTPVASRAEPAPPRLPPAPEAAPPASAPLLAQEVVLGAADAPVEVVEYLSATCPHCAVFARDVWPRLMSDYVAAGRLRLVIRETVTAPSLVAGGEFLLARCGGEAGYAPALERLFAAQGAILAPLGARLGEPVDAPAALLRAGAVLGLSEARTRACLGDEAAVDALNARLHAAEAAGIDGTPTFVFDGRVLKAGERLGRSTYEGGELTRAQFDAAYAAALRRAVRARTRARN